MSASTRHQTLFSAARLMSHLRTPLYRNGYALILSSITTSVLGVAYWILAAHSYTPQVVGLNSAAISAMMFLAGVAQLNLTSALLRFIPAAGRTTWSLVGYAYAISVVVAAAISLIFMLGLGLWAPALQFFSVVPYFKPWFIAATMAWCIFVLQDSVLTGLRQALWVPAENTVFSLVKIVLLVSLVGWLPQYGVFASWTIALLAALLPTNFLIVQRLIPRHIVQTYRQAAPIAPVQVVKYVAADYFGSLFWLVSTTLLPVIVTQRVGATANAYFYLTWTIAYSLYLVSPNMGSSLIVEAAADQTKLSIYSYRVFVQTVRLLLPMVAIVVLGAPYILRIFGRNYAAEGAMLLRLLALSAIPNIVNALYISVARVQRRLAALVAVLAVLCTLVLGLSYIWLKIYGITGVGLAWLVSQSLVAVVLWFTRLRSLWFARPAATWPGADLDNLGSPGQERAGFDKILLLRYAYRFMSVLHLVPLLHWLWQYPSNRRTTTDIKLIPFILPTVPPLGNIAPPSTWSVRRVVRTVSDMTVIMVGPERQPPAAVLKLPQTDQAVRGLHWQVRVLLALRADPRLAGWTALLPELLAEGELAGQPYVVEQMLPGLEARLVLSNPAACTRLQAAAAATIGVLHQRTAVPTVIGAELLERWIDEPLCLIQRVLASLPGAAGQREAIKRLGQELHGALAGQSLSLSWVHGDFVPGNILTTPDGDRVLGIVDWELARPNDLPLLDLLQLLLSTRVFTQRREVGHIIGALLNGAVWLPHEQALLDVARSALPGDSIELREMLLLSWLRHVVANLTKSTRYARNWLWVAENIEAVLRGL